MKYAVITLLALAMAACSSAPPTVQTGPDAEVSYDGLHLVDNSMFKLAWADPDADWARYDQFIPGGGVYEFRAVKKGNKTYSARSNQTEFWIDDADRAKLQEETSAIFREEMAKSERFTMTDTPDANVLIIRGALHDIVSNVPPDMMGRGEIYLSSVGEATLILEAVDSLSGEVIFRAVERRAAAPTTGGVRANSVTTWSEVRRMIRRWATTLQKGMDSLPTE
jgi:hypothetical protein